MVFFIASLLCGMFAPGASPVLAATLKAGDAPSISLVDPLEAPNDLDTPITITGSNFASDATVFLGSRALSDVVVNESFTSLTATVPWGLTAEDYTLTVTTSAGSAAIPKFTVTQALGQWNTSSLFGGPVHDIVKVSRSGSGAYLYAEADTGGIFYSSDGGANWTMRGNVPGNPGDVITLAVDPNNEQNLFIAQFKSNDGGATWSDLMPEWVVAGKGLADYVRTYINGSTLYAISALYKNPPNPGREGSGIAKSTNDGSTWSPAMTGLTDTNVTALAFVPDSNPSDPTQIFAGTSNGKIFYTANGGDSWTPFLDLNTGTPSLDSVGVLAINPFAPTELWVSTHSGYSNNAAMVKIDTSDPSNITITQVWGDKDLNNDQTREKPKSITFTNATTAYMGTGWDRGYKTSDDGQTWDDFFPTGAPGYGNPKPGWKILWDSDGTFYMPDERYGVQKTIDDGKNWTVINNGIQAMVPSQMVVDPTDPSVVYSKIRSEGWPGIFKSTDGGATWIFVELKAVSYTDPMQICSIAVDDSGRIYVGAMSSDGGRLFISRDQGLTWDPSIRIELNPDSHKAYQPVIIKANPQHPGTLIMGMSINSGNPESTGQIYRSIDYGADWTPMNVENNGEAVPGDWGWDLAFVPQNAEQIYLSIQQNVIFVSSDDGANWTRVNSFTNSNIGQGSPLAVETLPPYRLLAGRGYSDDGGKTWAVNNSTIALQQIYARAFLPRSATVYAGTTNGLYVSTDAGDNWQTVSGPLGSANIQSLAVADTLDRGLIYVGTAGGVSQVNPSGSKSIQSASIAASDTPLAAGAYRYGESRLVYLLLPADGTNLQTKPSSIQFVWQGRPDSKYYFFDISKDASFSRYIRKTVKNTTYNLGKTNFNVPKDGYFYWRVSYSLDTAKKILMPPSSVFTFSVPSLAPKLIWPTPSAKLIDTSQPFTWNPPPLMNSVAHYEFQISTNHSFTTLEKNVTTTDPTYTINALMPYGSHFWRVRAVSSSGQYTFWSSTRAFKLVPSPAPKLIWPAASAKLTDTSQPFTWNPTSQISAFDHYEFQVSLNPSFKTAELNDTSTGPAYTISASLPHGIKHWWRVRAISSMGWVSLWSSARAFKLTP